VLSDTRASHTQLEQKPQTTKTSKDGALGDQISHWQFLEMSKVEIKRCVQRRIPENLSKTTLINVDDFLLFKGMSVKLMQRFFAKFACNRASITVQPQFHYLSVVIMCTIRYSTALKQHKGCVGVGVLLAKHRTMLLNTLTQEVWNIFRAMIILCIVTTVEIDCETDSAFF